MVKNFREVKEKRRREREEEHRIEKENKDAIAKAKRENKNVYIRLIQEYFVKRYDKSVDVVRTWEVATPKGKIGELTEIKKSDLKWTEIK